MIGHGQLRLTELESGQNGETAELLADALVTSPPGG